MLTTQGFHTFTISKRSAIKHAEGLLDDLKKRTDTVRVRPDRDKNARDPFGHHWIVEYTNGFKGLTWSVRICHNSNTDTPCSIKATINPKVFFGIKDYLTAANADYLERVESMFNVEASSISSHLGCFGEYSLIRNDYCLNVDVNELGLPVNPVDMMKLIKRADIPPHYVEWARYDAISHRMKTGQDSFYLKSKSVVVNCYLKEQQLLREFPCCADLMNAHNLIRFEIQYRYPKMYSLSRLINEKAGFTKLELMQHMLSEEFCADVIRSYFNRVIGKGDYYTLDGARKRIEQQGFTLGKEQRLINELKMINTYRGIANAKAALHGDGLVDFRRSLRELEDMGINPVTIPREWNIQRIPNLLDAYYDSFNNRAPLTRDEKAMLIKYKNTSAVENPLRDG